MSLAALSLTAALPAAAGIAQSAVAAGGQLGTGFLNLLSGLAPGDKAESVSATSSGGASGPAKQALPTRTQSWSEKLISWLGRDRSSGDLEMQLSLDSLDQPQVSVQGDNAEAVEAALAQDPTWLQEFRELALDRSADLGGPTGGSLSAAPLSLKITQRDGDVQAAWQ